MFGLPPLDSRAIKGHGNNRAAPMFQNFDDTSESAKGAKRLAALRRAIAGAGLNGFIVPCADAFQGEYVADRDARLAWLTGFTGSAGFCAALADAAGVFVDGRYKVQVRAQVDTGHFTPVDWPATRLGPWLAERLDKGAKVGFDPWLHTLREIEELEEVLAPKGIGLVPGPNLVDAVWADRPPPPRGRAFVHPVEFAGEESADKRNRVAEALAKAGHKAAVLTLPDSICWLVNIRGRDIPRVPIVQAFAILGDDRRVALFGDPAKFDDLPDDPARSVAPLDAFEPALSRLAGPVRVDKATAPYAVTLALKDAGVEIAYQADPCRLPKACKNATELDGARAAHLTDAAAMVRFLHWLDNAAPKGGLTEIEIATRLEGFRREANTLRDISFDTISASGPNAALPHYRVTTASDRHLIPGELMLVDSGGQYATGTTDITRTVATGPVEHDAASAYTRVLQGVIAISRARFPRGLAGRDLDALARFPLWLAGQDFDHGTGHGVGSYLSVHEGPQGLSRRSDAKLEPGMILSNEPGYYREGDFGIRIENLIVVREAEKTGDRRDQLDFETITWVPIDTRPVIRAMLTQAEADWLNAYHREVRERVGPLVDGEVGDWLLAATAPL